MNRTRVEEVRLLASFDSEARALGLILEEIFLTMSQNQKTSLYPIGDVGGTGGYANIAAVSDTAKSTKPANQYLNDSLMINKLTERVYQLLINDLRDIRERESNYGPQRWL